MVKLPLINPVNIEDLKPLNVAEGAFAASLGRGELGYQINDTRPEKAIESGNKTNVIRAEVIRFFAWGGNAAAGYPIKGNVIGLEGAWIPDTLHLGHVPSTYSLVLTNCHIFAPIVMPHSEFRFLNLSGSILKHGLIGDGAKIESEVLMHEGFVAEHEVSLRGAIIGSRVICDGSKFRSGSGGECAINAEAIRVRGDFTMRNGFAADGEVRLLGANIGGDLNCAKGKFQNKNGVALTADKIKVGGSVLVGKGFSAEGEVRLLNADIGMGLHCDGGKFINKTKDALSADGVKVNGNVFMRNGFVADGEVCLLGSAISGDWHCNNSRFTNAGGKAIFADRIKLGGNLFMQKGFASMGEVRLSGARIGGNFACDGGTFQNNKGESIIADGISVGDNVLLRDGFSAKGTARMLDANIGGSLYCDNGQFCNKNGKALALDRATIKGDVSMQGMFSAKGEVRLLGVNIGGGLFCDGGNFNNETEKGATGEEREAINADGITVGRFVAMRDGFTAEGRVRLLAANIAGDMYCVGGKFSSKNGYALAADQAYIGGTLSMKKGFTAEGDVRLLGANIRGNLYCDGGIFKKGKEHAFNADRIQVGNNLRMSDSFSAEGGARLLNANVGGDFFCDGGIFKNQGGIALAIDGIKAVGDISMRKGFSAEGEVRLPYAEIGNNLQCDGGTFTGNFYAEGVKIKNSLRWKNVSGGGAVNLKFATTNVFDDDKESRDKFLFVLEGFSYKWFAKPASAESLIKWLIHRPKGDFTPQPLEQAATVLFAMGHDNKARDILLTKEQLLTKHGELPVWHKYLWRPLWNIFAGYGYRLWRTFAASFIFIAAGACVFDFADQSCRIVPHQPVVMAHVKNETVRAAKKCTMGSRPTRIVEHSFPNYPRFDAWVYSADVFIPFFTLHQESHWYPQPQKTDTHPVLAWLRWWHWAEIIAGWILTSLFVLTITGLLRPRQSSGGE